MRAQTIRYYMAHPLFFVRRVFYKVYELRHPDEPWISQGAIQFCENHLAPEMRGLEWGSGRSTGWFAARLKHLTSVEHDLAWHSIVEAKLKAQRCLNVDYRHISLDHDVNEPTVPEYPVTPAYVRVADEFEDNSLDLVIVDGHYRQACIRAALDKIKSGGLLLVDNTNWMNLPNWGVPSAWPVLHQSSNVMTQTTIWKKP